MNNNGLISYSDFEQGLGSCPVMAVLRGMSPAETVRLAEIAWSIGVTQVEVPIESENAVASFAATVSAGKDRGMVVGAGTITNLEQLRVAVDEGAAYGVSPGLDQDVVQAAAELSLPFLPGVSTPSEILKAQSLGFNWIKAFPATVLGREWFAAMRGPFPEVNLVATGGVNGRNAADILEAGARLVGVSRAFGDPVQCESLATLIADYRDK